ncbi:AMMECR1 domain protein [Thermodesulfatator indicus DSM 15286]|uniref:AMMECR1 domain protein n=1 Tax=Thermodesulfatator indicus (strain DSM 15286 / JCM 11887 / CIR29812) TaxID=667014 RepID=F8ACT8_THEID|nr:AmmeMemoRadiSam system protein A [Thermodesulfatator indicus]AEH44729.1 AMMECR1 domain protein [Thermodesulfatator indicus DSM 15286]
MAKVVGLNEAEKALLLYIARESITSALEGRPPRLPREIPPKLLEPYGAFVTLHKHGQLRGCIGTFHPEGPLYKTVFEMARSAAFNDPRFPPVTLEELSEIDIEISVLSPMWRATSIDEIEVGKHGIYIIRGINRGVLLPQVAVEYGWDRETFLDHTCLKAGLPPGCWQDPETEIYLFTAEIFSEKELGLGPVYGVH